MSIIIFCTQSITNVSCLFCNLLWENEKNCQAWNMDNLFNNKFNILVLIILKNPTIWSAACNFDSFRNAVDFDAGKMFISNWNGINLIRCFTILGTRIGTNIERVGVKLVFSNIFLEQDSSINLIRGIDWFLDAVLSLDKSIRWYFQAVDCLLVWTLWFLFFADRIAFCISSIFFGEVVVFYLVSNMGWWIKNSNLECGLYMLIITWSNVLWWSCCQWGDRFCEKN